LRRNGLSLQFGFCCATNSKIPSHDSLCFQEVILQLVERVMKSVVGFGDKALDGYFLGHIFAIVGVRDDAAEAVELQRVRMKSAYF
jgi:hypothetical protein